MSVFDSAQAYVSNLDGDISGESMADAYVKFMDEIEDAHDFEEQEYYDSTELVYGYWF